VESGLLPIGMFSRASFLSIKALRAYHEAGILVPARVDPSTGYRSYTVDQLADAAVVRRLRALDLPLDQVREVLRARDPDVTREILARHQIAMEARLADTERIVAELQSGVAPTSHTPVHVRIEEARDTVRLVETIAEGEYGDWTLWAIDRLSSVLREAGVEPAGVPATLWPQDFEDEDAVSLEAIIPIPAPFVLPASARDVSIGEIPAVRTAVLVHIGDYDSMLDTYRQLAAWVSRNAAPGRERLREWYLARPGVVDDPGQYRTEISWPIDS
jgi:DNA-binding transcriptional MerR regulator